MLHMQKHIYSKKPVICGTIENVVDTSKKWEELPFLRAQGTSMQDDGHFAPSTYIIGHNKETETWSLMEVLPTGHACLLASGKVLELFAAKIRNYFIIYLDIAPRIML